MNKIILLLSFLILIPYVSACKSKNEEPSKPSVISSDASVQSSISSDGHWVFNEVKDDFDNIQLRSCEIVSSNGIKQNGKSLKTALGIIQANDESLVYFYIQNDVSFDDNKSLRLKFDTEPPFDVEYGTSDNSPEDFEIIVPEGFLNRFRMLSVESDDPTPSKFNTAKALTVELPLLGIPEIQSRVTFDLSGYAKTCKFK